MSKNQEKRSPAPSSPSRPLGIHPTFLMAIVDAHLKVGLRTCKGGGAEAKTWFDDVCKVKYRVRHLKGQPQYIVVQALWPKVVCTAMLLSLDFSK
jgi:hypothetical protein